MIRMAHTSDICDIIHQEIDEITAAMVAPEPKIKLYKWNSARPDSSPIRLQMINGLKCDHPSPFKDTVLMQYSVKLNIPNKTVTVIPVGSRRDILSSIMYMATNTIADFIYANYNAKNNKLTAMYRWYRDCARYGVRNKECQADLFTVAKYLMANPQLKRGEPTTEGVIQALELIRSKYDKS